MGDTAKWAGQSGSLWPAVVVGTSEDACTVVAQDEREVISYAEFFPRPRVERVAPGHLVAITTASGPAPAVVWRWFDAVVLEEIQGQVKLWEPHHGEVLATPRDPRRSYRPGSRAYASAGLEGADWSVAGPAVTHMQDVDVELDEVQRFLSGHGLLRGAS